MDLLSIRVWIGLLHHQLRGGIRDGIGGGCSQQGIGGLDAPADVTTSSRSAVQIFIGWQWHRWGVPVGTQFPRHIRNVRQIEMLRCGA